MAKKSVTPSIRMNDDDYLRLRGLKEKHGTSWPKFVAYVNKLVEKDMRENGH